MRIRRIGAIGTAVTLCLVTTACGDDDAQTASTATAAGTTAGASAASTTASTAVSTAATASGTTAAGANDMDTPVIPTGANPQGLGQDPSNPSVFHGSGDFVLDTSQCPSDWSNDEGI